MIKVKVNNEYKDVVKIFCGGTLQKEIVKVWSREAQEYVYESSVEYTGSLPITITANGDALLDYRIYGTDGGVGEVTENLFDPNAKNVDNGYVAQSVIGYPNGNISSAYWAYVTEYIPVDSNTNYVMFMNLYRSEYTDWSRGLVFYDENKDFISAIRGCTALNEVTYENPIKGRISFTTPENCRYIRTNVDAQATMLMLVAASTPPPTYIPYGYKLPMVTRSENLFDYTATDTNNGYVSNSYISADGEITSTNSWNVSEYIRVQGNTNYFMKIDTGGYNDRGVAFYDSNKNYISGVNYRYGASNLPFSTPSNTKFLRLSTRINTVSRTMLVEGSTNPPVYIPYSRTDTPIYIGENQLEEDEYVSYSEQAIYKRTENLCPPLSSSKWSPGFVTKTGTIESPGRIKQEKVSDWIKVDGGNSYCFYNISGFPTGDGKAWLGIGTWDENRNWLYRYSEEATAVSYMTRDLPNDVAYVRLTMRTYGEDDDNLSFTKSSIPPDPYISYLKLTDPPVPLPAIPTVDGTTVIDCELADKPSQMYVKYRR